MNFRLITKNYSGIHLFLLFQTLFKSVNLFIHDVPFWNTECWRHNWSKEVPLAYTSTLGN
jgi:hypothetical protein